MTMSRRTYEPHSSIDVRRYDSNSDIAEILTEKKNYDMIIVSNPTKEQIIELTNNGFSHKPKKLRYFIDLPKSIEEYLENVSKKMTKKYQKVNELVEKKDIEIVFENGGDFAAFGEWQQNVYDKVIGNKKRGINRLELNHGAEIENNTFYSAPESEKISERIGIYLKQKGKICAGMIVSKFKDGAFMDGVGECYSVSYSTSDVRENEMLKSLNPDFYLLLKAMELSFNEKHKVLGGGMETNLYGDYLPVSILEYKRRQKYRPIPDKQSGDELIFINKLPEEKFCFPVMFHSYGKNNSLETNIFSNNALDETKIRKKYHLEGENINFFVLTDKTVVS